MLRMIFTAEDRCRVRLASGAHPTWELILSINSLQDPHLPLEYRGWRATVLTGARRAAARWRCLKTAAELVPAGNFPDFLTPALDETDVGAHFDTILSQPKAVLREDIVRTFARQRRVPRWARTVYSDGSTRDVVHALRQYSDLVLGPARPVLDRRVETDRARYAEHLLSGGVEALLANLHPSIRWRDPVLEADYPRDRTVALDGRGLVLVPTHFCWGEPVTFIDAAQQPMLVCPAVGVVPQEPVGTREDQLAGLVGRTRARLLCALAADASTTALAARLGVSPAAVSQHTKTLRTAGLITTTRESAGVHHSLTALGKAFLGTR
ncbi:ArsR/SmtB family transcription factor [Amycolatopsis circi]|uniref:ArsR/SmtB family transcription factor n=1 Tax=Amycolatopsis circi TaxID=871959 RepID=UPI0013BEA6F1|nr:ArsR family transcriptional regulator [Amycolatopsis circi]